MPNIVETRRQGGLRACNNLLQSPKNRMEGVDCGRWLHAPRSSFIFQQFLAWCSLYFNYTSIKIIKNGVGCRDDTMRKTRYWKAMRGGVRVCNNRPQPPKTKIGIGLRKICYILSLLLAVHSCISTVFGMVSSLHSTSIKMIFILVSLIFYPGLALTVVRGKILPVRIRNMHYMFTYVRACVLCAQIKTDVVTCTCNQNKMASV